MSARSCANVSGPSSNQPFSHLPRSPLAAASITSASVSASSTPANSSSPRTSTTQSQAILYVPPDLPDPRTPQFAAEATERIRQLAGNHPRPRLRALHQLRADERYLRPPARTDRVPHAQARRCAEIRAARGVPTYPQCRAVWNLVLLARRGRARRAAKLRDHRSPAVCGSQRSRSWRHESKPSTAQAATLSAITRSPAPSSP